MSFEDDEDDDDFSGQDDDGQEFEGGYDSRFESRRAAMLADFEKQLATDPRLIHYDEDEWIILADYASDLDNFYLLSEAVMRGLIAFPDSRELADRHLLLLNDVCRPSELRKVFETAGSLPEASKIARMYRQYYRWEDTEGDIPEEQAYRNMQGVALDSFRLTDQETIEAVRIMANMGVLHLMARDIELWLNEVEYRETLLYEITATAFDQSLYDLATTMVEKMVDEYPYNQKYWLLKARIHTMHALSVDKDNAMDADTVTELYHEACYAVETAIAIDPHDAEAHKLQELMDSRIAGEAMRLRTLLAEARADDSPVVADNAVVEELLKHLPADKIMSWMTPEVMAMFVESGLPEAMDMISRWVGLQMEGLASGLMPDADALGQFSFCDALGMLYVLDHTDMLDDILATVRPVLVDAPAYESMLVIETVRALERGELQTAERLLAKLGKCLDVNNTTDYHLLDASLNQMSGNAAAALRAYENYRLCGYLAGPCLPPSAVLTHFLLRKAMR